jgi:hypothetical protein
MLVKAVELVDPDVLSELIRFVMVVVVVEEPVPAVPEVDDASVNILERARAAGAWPMIVPTPGFSRFKPVGRFATCLKPV